MTRLWPVLISASVFAITLLFLTSHQLRRSIPWNSPAIRQQMPTTWNLPAQDPYTYSAHLNTQLATPNMVDILNSTFGFQEVQLISLPSRTDKRDSFALTASVSGFEYNITDGVDGDTISAKALPHTMEQNPKALGCWRAHLNVWQDMIRRNVASTLIFEDDVDWDVGIRAQMIELAKGSRHSLGETNPHPLSPYGDDWDVLWIGHCGAAPAPWTTRRYVISDDPMVEPPDFRQGIGQPRMSRWEEGPDTGNSTRLIFPAMGALCTGSYAISLKGAKKALYRTSLVPYNDPVDWGMNKICADRSFGFNCVAAYPPLIGAYRPAGNTSRTSDIGYGNEADMGIEEEGHSQRVVFSTRINLERLFRGDHEFQSAYPNHIGPRMGLNDIISAVGRPEEVPLDPRYVDNSNHQQTLSFPSDTEGLE